MTVRTLKDLYFHQLQDLHSACEQSLDMTTRLGAAARHADLGDALRAGHTGIADGIDKIRSICAKHGIDPTQAHCKGMQGLVAEAKAHALDEEFTDDTVRDAMIIVQYQRMIHYALAGYGSLKAFANRLGYDEDGGILDECLRQTEGGDATMTRIALSQVNRDAA
jgi:ferritin-like metal-binding protein YciE